MDRVIAIADDPRTDGAADLVLVRYPGTSCPGPGESPVPRRPESGLPQRRLVFHGHDTWGLGVANTLAAVDAGAAMVDGSLGGLGGCPFAPGASGNTSTEDLLFATQPYLVHPRHPRIDDRSDRHDAGRTR